MLSYFSATFSFTVLLLLTLALWRQRLQGPWLIIALLSMVVWSGYLAWSAGSNLFNPSNQLFLELLRNTAWILLLWKLYSFSRGIGSREFWLNWRLWLFGCLVLGLLTLNLLQGGIPQVGAYVPRSLPIIAPFLLVTLALVLLEQWYRNIPRERRWSVKFLNLGLLIIFGYDFLLYSEALLFQRIDPVLWSSRGWINAMMAPLIAISIARSAAWDKELRISHRVAFFSTGLLLAGIYLLTMAFVGYYLRWFGGGWGGAVQIVFVVLALSFFCLLAGSGRFRSLLTVWVTKHFFSYKYDYREEWMKASSRFALLPADEGYFEQLILGIAEPLDSLGGIAWVREGAGFVLKGQLNMEPASDLTEEKDGALLGFCEKAEWIIELPEYRTHPERYPGLTLSPELAARSDLWLLVPLQHQRKLYGVVGLGYPRAPHPINWEDHDLLKTLGAHLAALIALRKTAQSLTEARQFEAYHQLSAFVVHDIKNVVAQLSLVVINAEKHKANPAFVEDMVETLGHAVGRMNRMLAQLRQQGTLQVEAELVAGRALLESVHLAQKDRRGPIKVEFVGADEIRFNIHRERLVSVLCHLVQNAQDATAEGGDVRLELGLQGQFGVFKVIDTGVGMDAEFIRERLFKPFDTTKGRAGMGIGVYEARQFAVANGGFLRVESTPGQGSCFELGLPVYVRQ